MKKAGSADSVGTLVVIFRCFFDSFCFVFFFLSFFFSLLNKIGFELLSIRTKKSLLLEEHKLYFNFEIDPFNQTFKLLRT